MQNRIDRSKVRLMLGIFFALASVCGVACWAIAQVAVSNAQERGSESTLEYARLAARFVNVADHQKILSELDANSIEFRLISSQLQKVMLANDSILVISTIKLVNDIPVRVCNGERTDIEADRLDRAVGKPYSVLPDPGRNIRKALVAGHEASPTKSTARTDGPYQWAVVPLYDAGGQRVAFVYLERSAKSLSALVDNLWQVALQVFLLGVVASMVISWVLVRAIRAQHQSTQSRRHAFKLVALSGAFSSVGLLAILIGITAFSIHLGSAARMKESQANLRALTGSLLQLAPADLTLSARNQIVNDLKKLGAPSWLEQTRSNLSDRSVVLSFIASAQRKELEHQRTLLKELGDCETAMTGSAVVALTIALVCFAIVRASTVEQSEIEVLRSRGEALHRQQEQIVENLPIGFFSFRGSQVNYASDSWKILFDHDDSEEFSSSFESALDIRDQDRAHEILAQAEREGLEFNFTVRLGASSTIPRFVEIQGGPIFLPDGEFDCLVGSAIDVTSREHSRLMSEEHLSQLEQSNLQLQVTFDELEENFEATVNSLVKAVEAKDFYTAGHSERVMEMSVMLGQALGLGEHQLRVLRLGALIHDIGKIGVPDAILVKNSSLSDEEFSIMKQHPEIGAEMIERIPTFRECIPIVLYHHERMNGRGYPHRLTGEMIPLSARICAVADCFDAMTSNRAYRKALSVNVAIAELKKDAAQGALDPKIVQILADMFEEGNLNLAA